MQIGHISGATRVIGQSQGYLGLPLRDIKIDCSVNGPGTAAMETAWQPTPDELAALNAGAPVILRVLGTIHPPVNLFVGEAPSATEEEAEVRRLSADRGDPGYRDDFMYFRVELDGQAVPYCMTADVDLGKVWCYAADDDGNLERDPDKKGEFQIVEREGAVRIIDARKGKLG